MDETRKPRRWPWIVGALVLIIAIAVVLIYQQISALTSQQITPDTHVIMGAGGNVGVLKTSEGTVIVDSMTFTFQGEGIRQLAEELTGQPVVMIINTHYHLDHTHGNPGFPKGTRVVSTQRTLEHLKKRDASYWEGEAAHLLPNETFELEEELTIGNKTIRLYHPGLGHTDGDLVALFIEDSVIHLGDLFFNKHYPNIDLEAGGSVKAWGETIDNVFTLPFEKVIPGHGELTNAEGLRQFQRFIRQLAEVGETAASQGWSLEETIKNAALNEDDGYEPIEIPLIMALNRDFVLRRTWEEATGAVKPE
ncbi:MAG: MBL fold metallo-hydrolase [Pseudomonadota bacterium]